MKQNKYITDEERRKCRKVADAFAELENDERNVVIADAGRYGFVRLSYYNELYGFGRSVCYTNSTALFNALWQDWLKEQLFQIALEDLPLMDLEYEDIFQALPAEKQRELIGKRRYFEKKSGIMSA